MEPLVHTRDPAEVKTVDFPRTCSKEGEYYPIRGKGDDHRFALEFTRCHPHRLPAERQQDLKIASNLVKLGDYHRPRNEGLKRLEHR